MIIDAARDADAAGFGQLLRAVSDTYAVAEQIAALGYDIADVDADADLQPLLHRHRRIAPVSLLLDLNAQRVASTALANSAMTLSPALLKTRPRRRPSTTSRCARSVLSVPSSSTPISRL